MTHIPTASQRDLRIKVPNSKTVSSGFNTHHVTKIPVSTPTGTTTMPFSNNKEMPVNASAVIRHNAL